MKKFLSIVFGVIMLAVCSLFIAPTVNDGSQVSAAAAEEIVANVNETRFLNMLNHNFVYNTDFESIDAIVNNSSLALLDLRDAENEDFIKNAYVTGFVKDMYGIEIADMSEFNAEYPQMEGYLYIIPRGYTSYEHKIVSITENEDGSYKVVSEVTAINHDTAGETQTAISLFVPNQESAFGYNIIYCDIMTNTSNI
ncbi:MAG: hypothetical protein IJE02_04585 [Clostridia bacterium]|nr:hypothetical protein [Clostridia bacterium]